MKYSSYTKDWFVLLICLTTRLISAAVYLKPFSTSFIDTPAKFAAVVNSSGICGALHLADPLDACSPLYNPFPPDDFGEINMVLIVRGNCAFEDKIRNAQDTGFRAAIVYNDLDRNNLISMLGNSEGISVHAVFISKGAGEFLKKHAGGKQGECCIVPSIEDAAWTVLLISLISFVVILSVLAAFIIIRNQRPYMRGVNHQRAVIDTKMVEVLPSFIFNSAHSSSRHKGETCAICLEDYKDGENLRVLPCQHEFHSRCVDSWLTKWGTFCPVCKHSMNAHFTSSKDTISL